MPSIFLSHTSIDKPFVEKLANDLRRVGINVWFDKWEIKVGESITWRIEEGIKENEYLGIVLSPEALKSEWVKTELGAAWSKQMRHSKIGVLPILCRDCEIPLFLQDRRYADFRQEYQHGFTELANVLGVKQLKTINQDNWRKFTRNNKCNWKQYREKEFKKLVTSLIDKAVDYNWSTWVGGTANPFSITLQGFRKAEEQMSISIKLCGVTRAYKASLSNVRNPNNLKAKDFNVYVGNSINEVEEFVWRRMKNFRDMFGDPEGEAYHHAYRFLSEQDKYKLSQEFVKTFSWYQGENKVS